MLEETDVKDDQGNVIIQPGLKVRHKESQYEYTVEDVFQDGGEEITIVLNLPEEPRFDPPPMDSVMSDSTVNNKVMYEYDVDSSDGFYFEPEENKEDEETNTIAVPQKEFEKEYEVK